MSLERILCQDISSHIIQEHINRYVFASIYCRNSVILDVACGIGYGSRILRFHGAKKSVGVDVSKNAIVYAEKHYPESNFFIMDATQLGFRSEVFDVVCSFETIEHIKEFEKYLSEIKNLLKPGGLFIVSTPLKEAWSPYGNRSANPFHVREFSQKEFCSVISDFFQIVGIYGQGSCSIERFILYPYEVLAIGILGERRIFIDKILATLRAEKNREDCKVVPFRKNRFTIPKYIIAVCRKPKE